MSTPGERLGAWVQTHRMAFETMEAGPTQPVRFIERPSGKSLSFALGQLTEVEEARDPVRGGSYVRVLLEDGRSFAMTGIGFAFAPSFVNTGPLPDCPPVASFFDYEKIERHLDHLVEDTHEAQHREALQTVMILIAYLDGARAIGLEVGPEEQRLEKKLARLEARGIAP